MTANKRIALNIIVTYGRSLFAMACSLFTARWVLETLGHVDYGLYGVVGGVVGMLSYVNHLMSAAVSRFYAFSVGKAGAAADAEAALEDCRRWFNTAVAMHLCAALFFIVVCWPIGEWVIRNFLVIPPERLEACVWVFRISCLTSLVSVVAVPCRAMYTAKQEIAELTIYDFAKTALNVLFLGYMVTHPSDWLVRYAAWMSFLAVMPALIISARSFWKYRECRIVFDYWFDLIRFREIVRYAGLRFISSVSMMSCFEGMTVLVNKMLGPVFNAAMTIGNNIVSQVMSLTAAMTTSMGPAITNATGAGDYGRVRSLARHMDVCASLAVAVFAVPLVLELNEVLVIWLRNPPVQTRTLCSLMLVAKFISVMTTGEFLSLMALRNIGRLQVCDSVSYAIPFIVALIVFYCDGGLEGVGWGFIVLYTCTNVVKLYLAKDQCGLVVGEWIRAVLRPIILCVSAAVVVGLLPILLLPPSLWRVILTTICADSVLVVMAWKGVLTDRERTLLVGKVKSLVGR